MRPFLLPMCFFHSAVQLLLKQAPTDIFVPGSALHQLDQNTGCTLGMDKRDQVATCARSWGTINQSVAGLRVLLECGRKVGNAIRNVVQTSAAPVEEFLNGGVGRGWLDQLDAAFTTADERYIDALRRHRFNWCASSTRDRFEYR